MTNEQLRQNAAAMLAFAEGKPIESRLRKSDDAWTDSTRPSFDCELFAYRAKPEPVVRQWSKPDDMPVGLVYVRRVESAYWGSIAMSANAYGITGIGKFAWEDDSAACVGRIPWDALDTYEYSTDRKTWLPCTVKEEA